MFKLHFCIIQVIFGIKGFMKMHSLTRPSPLDLFSYL
jgi:hypothetical protein